MHKKVKKEIQILRRLADKEQPFEITNAKHMKVKFNVTNGQGRSVPQRFIFAHSPKSVSWIPNHRKNVLRMCRDNQISIPKEIRI